MQNNLIIPIVLYHVPWDNQSITESIILLLSHVPMYAYLVRYYYKLGVLPDSLEFSAIAIQGILAYEISSSWISQDTLCCTKVITHDQV